MRIESGNKQGVKVEWISQFDNGGGTACFDICKQILINSGLSSNSASPTDRFQIAIENKKLSRPTKQDEYLIVDMQIAKEGIEYLDYELESGYPVYLKNDYSLKGQSQIPSKHFYVVTQIRRNIR